jgi:hypothetical protein
VEKYEENHTKFKAKWSALHFEDYAYIASNWLNTRNKCAIVNAWTNDFLHLGNSTTSRAEGIHSIIKIDIETKNIDLLYTWDVINRVVSNQIRAIDHQQKA